MEEELKLLEENINNGIIYCGCGYTTEKAIEHLISAYKKLEEENEELKIFKQMALYRIDVIEPRELISKQAIRDKIEEITKQPIKVCARQIGRSYESIENVAKVSVLEELLEERNK